ncbi:hypothetical protein NIIDMKKI_54370 [Mycobacterium kansasii]|uniref:NADPH-dependent FMN reductase-like domain-containing protein n=1 Tax=Mycobacterium kansasii TaxID=1768 RepID=A0A7G1IGX6_MYCKA|nr:hypothetical protein NIIDMKKI_54370 [Mycobacterium kansasii]
MTESNIRVLALSGSLRRASYNTAALVAAQELAPTRMTIEIESLAAMPMFDEDTESAGLLPAVTRLAQRVAAADALLIATPSTTIPTQHLSRTRWTGCHERQSAPLPGSTYWPANRSL